MSHEPVTINIQLINYLKGYALCRRPSLWRLPFGKLGASILTPLVIIFKIILQDQGIAIASYHAHFARLPDSICTSGAPRGLILVPQDHPGSEWKPVHTYVQLQSAIVNLATRSHGPHLAMGLYPQGPRCIQPATHKLQRTSEPIANAMARIMHRCVLDWFSTGRRPIRDRIYAADEGHWPR